MPEDEALRAALRKFNAWKEQRLSQARAVGLPSPQSWDRMRSACGALLDLVYQRQPALASTQLNQVLDYSETFSTARVTASLLPQARRELRSLLAVLVLGQVLLPQRWNVVARGALPPLPTWVWTRRAKVALGYGLSGAGGVGTTRVEFEPSYLAAILVAREILGAAAPFLRFCEVCGVIFVRPRTRPAGFCGSRHKWVHYSRRRRKGDTPRGPQPTEYLTQTAAMHTAWWRLAFPSLLPGAKWGDLPPSTGEIPRDQQRAVPKPTRRRRHRSRQGYRPTVRPAAG